jgi:hypothetical protein
MLKADSVHSTPPTNTSSRRNFFAQAAAAVAGGATIGMTLPLPGAADGSERVPDPIMAAIEAHKVARRAVYAAVDWHSALDRELPIEKCRSHITVWREDIVPTDDPQWIACERAVMCCMNAETDAACTLINILPTTAAGAAALLKYAVAADTDGEGWPTELQSDDGKTRSWQYFLIANLAELLPQLMRGDT